MCKGEGERQSTFSYLEHFFWTQAVAVKVRSDTDFLWKVKFWPLDTLQRKTKMSTMSRINMVSILIFYWTISCACLRVCFYLCPLVCRLWIGCPSITSSLTSSQSPVTCKRLLNFSRSSFKTHINHNSWSGSGLWDTLCQSTQCTCFDANYL